MQITKRMCEWRDIRHGIFKIFNCRIYVFCLSFYIFSLIVKCKCLKIKNKLKVLTVTVRFCHRHWDHRPQSQTHILSIELLNTLTVTLEFDNHRLGKPLGNICGYLITNLIYEIICQTHRYLCQIPTSHILSTKIIFYKINYIVFCTLCPWYNLLDNITFESWSFVADFGE